MFLKAITHFFAKKGLASHEADTRAAISRYEREKEASEFRINERMVNFRERLQSHADKRDEDLKKYVDELNEFIAITAEMQPSIHKLYDQMFLAFDAWGKVKLTQQDLDIERSKRNLLQEEINLFKDALAALELMAQNEDKKRWHDRVESQPLGLDNKAIKKELKTVGRWQANQERELADQRKRIESAIRQNCMKLGQCRKNIKDLTEQLWPLKEELKRNRDQVRETYFGLCDYWKAAKNSVDSMYAGQCDELYYYVEEVCVMKETPMKVLFSWLSSSKEEAPIELTTPKGWGTKSELKESCDLFKADLDELFENKKKYQNELNHYSDRIKEARSTEDYSTFDQDKTHRSIAFNNKKETQDKIGIVKPKKDQLSLYLFKIRKMTGWLQDIHPQVHLNRMYNMCKEMQEEGEEMYQRSCGLKVTQPKNKGRQS